VGVGVPQLPAPGELGWHAPPVQVQEPQQSVVAAHFDHACTQALVWLNARISTKARGVWTFI
jgi:hypothetical protein